MAKKTLARRTATVVVVAGAATATLAVTAEPAAANHKDYCDHGTHYGTHAGRSYRVVYQHTHEVSATKHDHHYLDQEQIGPGIYQTIGDYHKNCPH